MKQCNEGNKRPRLYGKQLPKRESVGGRGVWMEISVTIWFNIIQHNICLHQIRPSVYELKLDCHGYKHCQRPNGPEGWIHITRHRLKKCSYYIKQYHEGNKRLRLYGKQLPKRESEGGGGVWTKLCVTIWFIIKRHNIFCTKVDLAYMN